jgi:RND family efflux transporter MFP subunit
MPEAAPTAAPATPTASLAGLRIDRSTAPSAARPRRRWPWVLGAVVVLAGGAALLAPRKPAVQVTTVQTAWPSAQYSQLAASGYVVAQRRAAVASKATGRLVELNVREGSAVKKGELLARVDASDVQASLGVAEAGAAQAEAALKQAEAALAQARVQQANADADLARSRGLAAQNFLSPQALDAADTRARAAQAATATQQAALATARAAVAQARAQVRVQQVSRDSTDIRAPFDGVVLVKNANVGDLITPFSNASGTSAAVVTLADMGTLEVEADVSEANVSRVKLDQPVEITLDAIPDTRFRGAVARIVPTVDRAKATVMTKVRFEALDPRILPEMSAKVSFLSQRTADGEQQPVLAVNPAAVVTRDGATVVLRLGTGEVLEAVPVQAGRSLGDVVELRGAGLKAGDRLVLSPAAALAAGGVVTVAPAGGK